MALLMRDTENKREVVAAWLESIGLNNELSDAEPDNGTDWGLTLTYEREDGLYRVDWVHSANSLVLETEIDVTDDHQQAFAWMGVVHQLLFMGDVIDCIASHSMEFEIEYQPEADGEKDTSKVPIPESITIVNRLLADEGISRALFFERYRLLRSVRQRVNIRLDRMHLLKAWT